MAGIVAVNLVLAASQDSAIDNLGPPLRGHDRALLRAVAAREECIGRAAWQGIPCRMPVYPCR